MNIRLLFIFAVLSVIFACSSYRLTVTLGYNIQHKYLSIIKNSAIILFISIISNYLKFSLLLIALAYYIAFYYIHSVNSQDKIIAKLHTNLFFIFNMTISLIFLGFLSLSLYTNVSALLKDNSARVVCIFICVIVHIITNYAYCCFFNNDKWTKAIKDFSVELKAFLRFINFAFLFTAAESIPLSLSMPISHFSNFYIISSNALVFIIILVVLIYTIKIFHKTNYENEYFRLKTEQENIIYRKKELEQVIYTDTLTGINSRKKALDVISDFIKDNKPFSVVYIDLDDLKKINDSQGHNKGDSYLIAFVTQFKALIRQSDVFARIGGDEFIVIMPDYSYNYTVALLNNIRKKLSNNQGSQAIAFSFGVSEYNGSSTATTNDLIANADKEMYSDKQNRKNKKI